MKQAAALVLTLILATSACASNNDHGGGATEAEPSGNDEHTLTAEQHDAVAKIERGYPSSDWAETDDPTEVHCIVLGWVSDFGIEKLQKYGVVDAHLEFDRTSSTPMSAADAALFTDAGLRCGDFEARVAEFIKGENPPMSDSELKRCVKVVTKDDIRRATEDFLQETGTGPVALYAKLHAAGCGPVYSD